MLWTIIIGVVALSAGIGAGWALRQKKALSNQHSAEAKAETLVKNAKAKEQEIIIKAKEQALKVLDESKKEEQIRRDELRQMQERVEKRENMFDQKLSNLENQKEELEKQKASVIQAQEEVEVLRNQQIEKLESIANMNREDAIELMVQKVAEDESDALDSRIRKIQNENQEIYDNKMRDIMTLAIQRCGLSHAAETTSTVLQIPSDEMKGRIIGREGRNIKALEEATGVEIIVDDTPESILISGFSPIRRHLAKRALEALIEDGRIHPTKIEDSVLRAKKQLQKEIYQAGEEALYEMGIAGIDPKLIQILGRMRYRSSYGQNVLRHSIEVGFLAGLIAEQLGADVTMCRKAGLFHDIGKALDHDIQGTHPDIGRDIGRKFGFTDALSDAAFCHHDDNPPTLEALIVKTADCISGGRPGARKDSYEQYIQRLEELESTAKQFHGVSKVYAIQAGREIRVFVEPEMVDDYAAHNLARDIAKQIEEDLKYPGEIKVNVIRETRVTEYAR